MLTGWPLLVRSCSACRARVSVWSRRWRAAAMRWWELSARIVFLWVAAVLPVFECADDGQQVRLDDAVHFGHALVVGGLGVGDEGSGVGQLALVLGQELGGGDE